MGCGEAWKTQITRGNLPRSSPGRRPRWWMGSSHGIASSGVDRNRENRPAIDSRPASRVAALANAGSCVLRDFRRSFLRMRHAEAGFGVHGGTRMTPGCASSARSADLHAESVGRARIADQRMATKLIEPAGAVQDDWNPPLEIAKVRLRGLHRGAPDAPHSPGRGCPRCVIIALLNRREVWEVDSSAPPTMWSRRAEIVDQNRSRSRQRGVVGPEMSE